MPNEVTTLHKASNEENIPGANLLVAKNLAEKAAMTPGNYVAAIKAMCITPNKKRPEPIMWEEIAAFLIVCDRYNLDPLRKEIHAFQAQNGMIVPVVGIDGWISMVQRHPDYDGEKWEEHEDANGNITAMTCIMYNKRRSRPTEVKELLKECFRDTQPWKTMTHRMMRHKSYIQSARYAFGFSGVYDEDEARDIVDREEATPQQLARRTPPDPSKFINSSRVIEGTTAAVADEKPTEHPNAAAEEKLPAASVEAAGAPPPQAHAPAAAATEEAGEDTGEVDLPPGPGDARFDFDAFMETFDSNLADCGTKTLLQMEWAAEIDPMDKAMLTTEQKRRINECFAKHQDRVSAALKAEMQALTDKEDAEKAKAAADEVEEAAARRKAKEAAAKAEKEAAAQVQQASPSEAAPADPAPAANEDAARLKLIKGLDDTLKAFTDIEQLEEYWEREVASRREEGEIGSDDYNFLSARYDATEKLIKAGLTAPPGEAKKRRDPPPPPAEKPAEPAKPATAASATDPASNEGTMLMARARKAGKLAAGGGKAREVPGNYANDATLAAEWLAGYDSNVGPS